MRAGLNASLSCTVLYVHLGEILGTITTLTVGFAVSAIFVTNHFDVHASGSTQPEVARALRAEPLYYQPLFFVMNV